MKINNRIAAQQTTKEELDKEKSQLLNERDDNNNKKTNITKKNGQILMTIENLYAKCDLLNKRMMVIPATTSDQSHPDKLTRFDDSGNEDKKNKVSVAKIVHEHLQTVLQSFKNYKNLQD